MKIFIVGPGAMGSLFAARLVAAGQDVWLFDRNKKRASYIERNGLRVSGLANLKVKVKVVSDYKEIKKSELVIFAVKSYDLKSAACSFKRFAGKDTFFMGLQNGLGNIDILSRVFGKKRVLAAVTNQGATLLKPGHCRYAGKGITYLGSLERGQEPILKKTKEIFKECGIKTEISRDINSLIWGKLMINIGINAITAICHIKNGRILKIKETKALMKLLVEEAQRVAKSLNIELPFKNAVKQAENVCRKTANNISSMLQDIQRGKKTEIDFINGAIINIAEKKGLNVPYNKTVTYLVKAIEREYA